ncbi:MAG: phage major capsid protein [Rhodobacteraceae bacterium]|nr:phage major capsid protein [Paracoccaceae bacterium]
MADIIALRAKMAKLAADARSKFDEITDKTTEDRATEITAEFDAMMTEHSGLSATLERELKLEEIDTRSREIDTRRRPNGGDVSGNKGNDDDAPTYREAFHEYLRAQGNVAALPTEVREVLNGGFGQVEERAQTAGTNSAGGFSVPDEMMANLIRTMAVWGPMYDSDICTIINTSGGNPLPMPTVNDTASTAGASTEGATLTDDGGKDVVFAQKTLDAFSFNTEWVRCSLELAMDSSEAMETLLTDLLGERLGRTANLQLSIGSGSGEPHGLVTATGAGKTAAATGAVTADELLDLVHSIDPAYRVSPKTRMMFNDTTLLALRKLKDGQGNYLITEAPDGSGRMTVGSVAMPYSINQAMASMATGTKPIVFGDFGKYFVRKAGGVLIGAIDDKDFWPSFGVAGYMRLDGELGDTAAIKHLIMA